MLALGAVELTKFLFGREVGPYMGYIGMFHSEGYSFQAAYSGIGYKESLGSRKLIN